MNVTCIICSDMVLPHSDVYATQCGHLFHYCCLIQWIERSKTCPQCRNRATEKTIFRIYLNIANTEGIVEDAISLQNKVDNLQFQLKLKEKDVSTFTEKCKKMKGQTQALREEVASLENQARVHDSVVHAFKDQIAFFKSKAKEKDRLVDELSKLKIKLKQMESLEIAVNGSREAVNEMLRQQNDPESLVILAATLKKALLDAEKKKHNFEHKYQQLQSEVTKCKRQIATLEVTNKDFRKEIEWHRSNSNPKQIRLSKEKGAEEGSSPNRSIPIDECLTPFSQKASACAIESTDSPSVEEKLVDILQSDSPYLCTKTNIMGIDMTFQQNKKNVEPPNNTTKMMIFKRPAMKYANLSNKPEDDVVYNGLGGHSKEDVFPSRKVLHGAIKRHRTHPSTTSTKFKKVAALSTKK